MSRTGYCPLCEHYKLDMHSTYKGVHVCVDCQGALFSLSSLSAEGNEEAKQFIVTANLKIEQYKERATNHPALDYAAEHWGS